jgi:hypothetical protein
LAVLFTIVVLRKIIAET